MTLKSIKGGNKKIKVLQEPEMIAHKVAEEVHLVVLTNKTSFLIQMLTI